MVGGQPLILAVRSTSYSTKPRYERKKINLIILLNFFYFMSATLRFEKWGDYV